MVEFQISRRQLIVRSALGLCGAAAAPVFAGRPALGVEPALMRRALAARERHRARLAGGEVMAIADFSRVSSLPRFHIVDLVSGATSTLLVAHGRGSDPAHSGWLRTFSNRPGSAASSAGAYATGDLYTGKHGRSRRLIGLDPENDNAFERAIVIHAAWYVGPNIIRDHGKLGRSEGCFAVSEADLSMVLDRLGPGCMIYADKI